MLHLLLYLFVITEGGGKTDYHKFLHILMYHNLVFVQYRFVYKISTIVQLNQCRPQGNTKYTICILISDYSLI